VIILVRAQKLLIAGMKISARLSFLCGSFLRDHGLRRRLIFQIMDYHDTEVQTITLLPSGQLAIRNGLKHTGYGGNTRPPIPNRKRVPNDSTFALRNELNAC